MGGSAALTNRRPKLCPFGCRRSANLC